MLVYTYLYYIFYHSKGFKCRIFIIYNKKALILSLRNEKMYTNKNVRFILLRWEVQRSVIEIGVNIFV